MQQAHLQKSLDLRNFSAVIFDMDGLVLDTESSYCYAWQQAAAAMGFTLSEAFCLALSGLQAKDVEQALRTRCGADFNMPVFNDRAGRFWRDYVDAQGINIKRGFIPLLEYIIQQRIPFCLATNSRSINAYECLELAGLKDVFPLIVTRDDVELGKPEPDIFLTAAQLLPADISRCLVVEDSHAGIIAANKAGAFSVLVPSITPVDPQLIALCDTMMNDLAQLLETFQA